MVVFFEFVFVDEILCLFRIMVKNMIFLKYIILLCMVNIWYRIVINYCNLNFMVLFVMLYIVMN